MTPVQEFLGQGLEYLFPILPLVRTFWAMEADVNKISRDFQGGPPPCKVVQTQCSVVLREHRIGTMFKPTVISKLKDKPVFLWQHVEKLIEALQIHFPTGGQLKQDWSKLVAEQLNGVKKFLTALFRIFKFFHVRHESTGFTGKKEMLWRFLSPFC